MRIILDKLGHRYSDDMDAATAVVASGEGLSGASPEVGRYEQALRRSFDAANAIAVSSGGAALSAALHATGVKPGDEVLVSPASTLCTVLPILNAGATPVFVDTAPDHWGIDLVSAGERITARTRAILETPMFGYPTPLDRLNTFARQHGVRLIGDLAHAHGSMLHHRPLAAFCDIACYSTHDRKPLSTGEGGFVLTPHEDLAERVRAYTRFGHLTGSTFGLNYKLGGLPAAVGRSRLKHLSTQLANRRSNAARLLTALKHPQVRETVVLPGGTPNYYVVVLLLNFGASPSNRAFIYHLTSRGIPSDVARYGGRVLYEYPILAPYRRPCPNAESLLAAATTLPIHPDVTRDDIDYMVDVINRYPA